MRYNHFDMLPERAFLKVGGRITLEGGGGGGPSSTQTTGTTYQTNIPEYAQPYVTTMLNATQQQLFNMQDGQITGFNPYRAYGGTYDAQGNQLSYDPSKSVAGFSPLQTQAQTTAANLQTPGQFAPATDLATQSGYGSLGAANQAAGLQGQALGYGAAGAQYGDVGQMYGAQGAQQANMAAQQAARQAQMYGRQGAMTGGQALGYGSAAAGYGTQAAQAAQQGFGAGEQYARQATDPYSVQAYMSPYMQNVVDYQKTQALRDYGIGQQLRKAQAVGAGAFGGSRQAILEAEAQRNLGSQIGGIEAQGAQQAFQNAQQAQQFGANLGLQGLGAGYQGLGMGIQGAQAGMQGVSGAQAAANLGLSGVGQQLAAGNLGLAGTAQGIQGAQAGMQGAGVGLTGLQGAIASGQYGLQGLGQAGTAAGQLGSLGAQQLAAEQGVIQTQAQQGASQQALQQQILNQAIQDYANAQQYPLMQLGTMSNMLRGLPMQAASTQQYVAQANPTTQAIGTIGSLGSLYGAFGGYGGSGTATKGAKGGIMSAKKMAKGGIASYDVGGKIDALLSEMSPEELQKQLQSPSVEIRKRAKLALAEKSIEGKAGGGIIAFARPTEENNQSLVEEPETATDVRYAPNIKGGRPTPPAPAQPAPVVVPTDSAGVKRLLAQQAGQDIAVANAPTEQLADKRAAYIGPDLAGQKYRESVMAERANSEDEFRRQNYLRAAQIFADWGSQPGNTLVAGMNALKGRIGDIITDRQDRQKYLRETDKILYELDRADRAERAGNYDKAETIRQQAGERGAKNLGSLSDHITKEMTAENNLKAAYVRASGTGAGDKSLDRWADNLRSANDELKRLKNDAEKDPTLTMDVSKMAPDSPARKQIEQKQAAHAAAVSRAQADFILAKQQVDKLSGGAPTSEASNKPEQVTIGDKTYARPAGFTDAQWAQYKKDAGAK